MNAWLIECEPPLGDTLYFCNDGDWCSNPNHAHKFATAVEAQAKLTTMQNPLSMRIAEHEWPEDARCDACSGSGEVVRGSASGDPQDEYAIACPECGGSGRV